MNAQSRREPIKEWPLPGTATDAILWLILMVYLGQMLLQSRAPQVGNVDMGGASWFFQFDSSTLWAAGGYTPGAVLERGDWWRMFMPTWLHGGLVHVGLNCWVLHQFGRWTEDLIGPRRMLLAYGLAGLGTCVLSMAWDVAMHQARGPAIGASGAVMGLGGLLIVMLGRRSDAAAQHIRRELLRWAVMMLIIGFVIPFIDQVGHIAGFISGALVGLLMSTNHFDHLKGPTLASRARTAGLLLLLAANLGAIGFSVATVETRLSDEIAMQQLLRRGYKLAERREKYGETPDQVKARLSAIRTIDVPADLTATRDAIVKVLSDPAYPRADLTHRLSGLFDEVEKRWVAHNPDRYGFLYPGS